MASSSSSLLGGNLLCGSAAASLVTCLASIARARSRALLGMVFARDHEKFSERSAENDTHVSFHFLSVLTDPLVIRSDPVIRSGDPIR